MQIIKHKYVGYREWLPPSHPSVSSLIPLPHFWQTGWDRSGPDLDCFSSKRNWLCSSKHGETELEQIQKDLEIPISDQNRSAIIHLHLIYFHHLILHLLKSKTKLHNQHNCARINEIKIIYKLNIFGSLKYSQS